MTTQVVKALKVLSIHSNCEVTDCMSTDYKNDMWTEITICRLRTVRMSQVWKCRLT